MKILFLDIDGVLNNVLDTAELYVKGEIFLPSDDIMCERNVRNLERIMDEFDDLHIVVSSYWRWGRTNSDLRKEFKRYHFKYVDRIIDQTPIITKVIRGREIQTWLNRYKTTKQMYGPVEQIIILDDAEDMGKLENRLIKTDEFRGLTRRDAEKAIQLLKR